MNADPFDLTRYGGRLLQGPAKSFAEPGSPEVWDFGYLMPEDRTRDQRRADVQCRDDMIPFGIRGA